MAIDRCVSCCQIPSSKHSNMKSSSRWKRKWSMYRQKANDLKCFNLCHFIRKQTNKHIYTVDLSARITSITSCFCIVDFPHFIILYKNKWNSNVNWLVQRLVCDYSAPDLIVLQWIECEMFNLNGLLCWGEAKPINCNEIICTTLYDWWNSIHESSSTILENLKINDASHSVEWYLCFNA